MRKNMPRLLYSVKDTDLTEFVCRYHILAGDYLREMDDNLLAFLQGGAKDFTAIFNSRNTWLDSSASAYQASSDLHNLLYTTDYQGARVFLFHVDHMENGHAYGNILLTDTDFLCRDVNQRTIYPVGILATDKNGSETRLSFEQWAEMNLSEKEAFALWDYQYTAEALSDIERHCASFFETWDLRADLQSADYLLLRLNDEYMSESFHPRYEMYRIPPETAKQMLLYNDAPVYRLEQGGPKEVKPLAAIKSDFWKETPRPEFAVKTEGLKGIAHICRREINRLLDTLNEHQPLNKSRPSFSR